MNSRVYEISLGNIAVQKSGRFASAEPANRLVGMRNNAGADLAVGLLTGCRQHENTVTVRAPALDLEKISCIVIGDAVMDINNQQM